MLNHLDELLVKFDLSSHILTILKRDGNAKLVVRFAFLKFSELESRILSFPIIKESVSHFIGLINLLNLRRAYNFKSRKHG